jgi:hypothetical protein
VADAHVWDVKAVHTLNIMRLTTSTAASQEMSINTPPTQMRHSLSATEAGPLPTISGSPNQRMCHLDMLLPLPLSSANQQSIIPAFRSVLAETPVGGINLDGSSVYDDDDNCTTLSAVMGMPPSDEIIAALPRTDVDISTIVVGAGCRLSVHEALPWIVV